VVTFQGRRSLISLVASATSSVAALVKRALTKEGYAVVDHTWEVYFEGRFVQPDWPLSRIIPDPTAQRSFFLRVVCNSGTLDLTQPATNSEEAGHGDAQAET